ncbi:MAG: hypothetical protein JWL59_4964 [Chthoniobacteraceae bacterium]|nr:hypothetical protein [Chthoniobacteraceae bacterium]
MRSSVPNPDHLDDFYRRKVEFGKPLKMPSNLRRERWRRPIRINRHLEYGTEWEPAERLTFGPGRGSETPRMLVAC